jgi:hypothetical protein
MKMTIADRNVDLALSPRALLLFGWLYGMNRSVALDDVIPVARAGLDELIDAGLAHLSSSGRRADLTEAGRAICGEHFEAHRREQ